MNPNEPGFGWSESYLGGSADAEDQMFRDFERTIVALQQNMSSRGDGVRRRGFHAKTILNVPRAVVHCGDAIPSTLQVGIFQPDREYPAVVRFSSSLSDVQPDANRQGHGIAFRITAPEGIHDVLLSDSPASHARDAEQFMALADALTSRRRVATIARLVRRVGLREAVRMLYVVLSTSTANMASVATVPYWSRTPFSFRGAAARLVLKPRDRRRIAAAGSGPGPGGPGPDYLGNELRQRLTVGDVEFDLAGQLYVDGERTPIEDGSVEWLERDSPPIHLARLTMPRQDLTSPDAQRQAAAIDQIAFTPWNVVGEIQPLGSLNRARKPVYLASARERGGSLAPGPAR